MDPTVVAVCVAMSLAGCAMGTFSGIVPGIHVNTLAAVMLAAYPAIEGALPEDCAAVAVGSCIMSASVVHSFVDFVPSVFIGAPDSEDAVSVLPGHRLLLAGRGMEAVRAAAIGSLVGCSASILLALPLQWALVNGAGDLLERLTPVVLLAACAVLLMNEWRRGSGIWGAVAFLVSGALGLGCMVLPIPVDGALGEGSVMMPLLTGLFGIPVMLSTSEGTRIPEQRDLVRDPVGPGPGIRGVVMGTLAGWFPGITATVGASMSAAVFPERDPARFISTVASVGTVTSVLALVTLAVSGNGRSGTALAIGEVLGDSLEGFASGPFLLLLLAAAVGSAAGYHLTILTGRAMSRMVGRMRPRALSRAVLVLLVALTLLLCGPAGLVVLMCSTVVGFIPEACGTGRVILCGCLILPVLMFEFGLARSLQLRPGLGHEPLVVDDEALVGAGSYLPCGVPDRHPEDEPPAVDLHELRLAGDVHAHGRRRRVRDVEAGPYRAGPPVEVRGHAAAGRRLDERYHGRGGEHREGPAPHRHGRVVIGHRDRPGPPDACREHGWVEARIRLNCDADPRGMGPPGDPPTGPVSSDLADVDVDVRGRGLDAVLDEQLEYPRPQLPGHPAVELVVVDVRA